LTQTWVHTKKKKKSGNTIIHIMSFKQEDKSAKKQTQKKHIWYTEELIYYAGKFTVASNILRFIQCQSHGFSSQGMHELISYI